MEEENDEASETIKNKRGRPKKVPRVRPNAGRKQQFDMRTAGRTSQYILAKKIVALADNNEEFLEYTLNLCRRLNKKFPTQNCNKETIDDSNVEEDEENFDLTKESALALYIEGNLNVKNYGLIATECRLKGYRFLPSYPYIKNAMDECAPNNIKSSEVEVVVPLQDLLNKTVERLCEAVALDWDCNVLRNVKLYVTCGFDSSSGHFNPHQHYDNPENINVNPQQSLLVTSCLIQQLVGSEDCSWINPVPSSPRTCRPWRISFEKEDNEAIIKEHSRISREIHRLKHYSFKLSNGKKVNAEFIVTQTLYDGKCVNHILGNNATTRCPICGVSSHKFGDPTVNFDPKEGSLCLGLGPLHLLIKVFEYLLHLAYRMPIKQWDRHQHLMEIVNKHTDKIRKQVDTVFGSRVDQVLQGHGTSNTANLSRTCMSDPKKFAAALGIDFELVYNLALILRLLQSKQHLNINQFQDLCEKTYKRNFAIYPWSRMCPSVHKLLKHSSLIIQQFPLPIAYYSEEASEAWHKNYRKNLLVHARQNSRENRILDTFNRAVYTTDPLISLIYINHRLKGQLQHPITQEMRKYLKNSEQIENEEVSCSDNNQDYNSEESDYDEL